MIWIKHCYQTSPKCCSSPTFVVGDCSLIPIVATAPYDRLVLCPSPVLGTSTYLCQTGWYLPVPFSSRDMEFDRLGDNKVSPFECVENNKVKLKFVSVELRWNGFKSHAGRNSGWNELNQNNQVPPLVNTSSLVRWSICKLR